MVTGVKITLFLADGRPNGLRFLDQANWSGLGIDFARADWKSVRDEPELRKPGVYILRGEQDDGTIAIYIGEGDELRARLSQHQATLDFWSRATAFVTKDDTLNKASVKYLEARLVDLGTAAKRATLLNSTAPGLPAMSRADIAEAEGYLEHLLPMLPILGITAFELAGQAAQPPSSDSLSITRSGIVAKGRETEDGFLVEAESTARVAEQPAIHPYMQAIRARLVRDGLFVAAGQFYRLTQDQLFGSPSTAAGVLLGRSASGPMEWKDDTGRSLKALRTQASEAFVTSRSSPAAPPVNAVATPPATRLKLHEAVERVLIDNGNAPMTPRLIASEINRRKLYAQRAGSPVPAGQISARLSHYTDRFERTTEGIRIRDDWRATHD